MERLISYISRGFMLAGGIALLLLVLLATLNVSLRLFKMPYSGTYEIASFLGAIVTAAALGHTQRKKDHIVVDILSEKFPPAVKRGLNMLNYAVTSLLFGVIAWQIFAWGQKIRTSGELSETLQLPYHGFVYGVAAGFALLAGVLFIDLMRSLFHRGEEETA